MIASDRRAWAAVLILALALRVGVAFAWTAPLVGDAADYHRLAAGLASGRGYVDANGRSTAWRPPAYPAFLAGVYRTLGDGPRAIGLAQALVGAAAAGVLGWGAALTLGAPAGLLATALVAVDAAQLALVSRRLSEGLCTLLLAALLVAVARLRSGLRSGRTALGAAAAAGVLGGLVTLTRGLFVGLPLALAAALLWEGRMRRSTLPGTARRAALAAAVLVAAYGAALVPWTVRNARALGAFVPIATQGGITLYASWFPPESTFGVFPDDGVTRGAIGLSEPEQSRWFVAATKAGLARDPDRVPRLLLLKALYLLVPLDWEVLPRYGGVNPTYLLAAGWAGAFLLVLGRGRRWDAWPLWLPLLYLAGVALVFYGSPRLRAPMDPLLAALGAAAVVELGRRKGRARAAAAFGAAAGLVLGLTAFAVPLKASGLAVLRGAGVWRR